MEKSLLPLLTYIIGMYDPYGVSHSARVRDLTIQLAERYGVQKHSQTMKDIELAANLHDIGKIGIPEAVRRQPGKFLEAERLLMQQHAVIGYKILDLVRNGLVTEEVCRIVKHHHEDWSGGGYPDGIRGTEIPLGSRLIRVCDFYDAIISVRGYQQSMTPTSALQLMADEQILKTWADPEILRTFMEMMRERFEHGGT